MNNTIAVFIACLLFQFLLSILTPPMISHDGYGYLSSGKALFSNDFPFRYQLMREPGYPFLVWIAYQTGNVLLTLSLIQSLMLSASVAIFFWIFTEKFDVDIKRTLFALSIGLFAVRGYANTVLQLCSIIFILSLFIFYLFWLPENRNRRNKPFFFTTIVGILTAATNSALTCAIIASLICALCIAKLTWRKIVKFMAALIIGIASVLIPWYTTIFPVDVNSQMIPSPHTSFELRYFKNTSLLADNTIRLKSLGTLLFLYPDSAPGYPKGYSMPGKELMMFGNYWDYGKTGDCLINHGGQAESIEYVSDSIKPRCVIPEVLAVQRIVSRILTPVYLSSGLIFIAALILAFLKKNTKMQVFLLPIATLILVYGFGGAGISRFSAILPLISPALAVWFVTEISKTKSKRSSYDSW